MAVLYQKVGEILFDGKASQWDGQRANSLDKLTFVHRERHLKEGIFDPAAFQNQGSDPVRVVFCFTEELKFGLLLLDLSCATYKNKGGIDNTLRHAAVW